MDKDWTIREELYKTFHRWPTMIVFFIIGCIIGWVASLIWPSDYQAISQVSVGLDPYRTYSDTAFLALAKPRFRNLDDYKNWQLSTLETIIFFDVFVDDALDLLRQEDPYWETVERNELRDMLSVGWRSTGTWDMRAQHPEAQRAMQAAAAWSRVSIDIVMAAVQAARDTFMIDQERQEVINERLETEKRVEELKTIRATFTEWEQFIRNQNPEGLIPYEIREQLFTPIAQIADFSPGWLALMNAFPDKEAPTSDYIPWIQSTISMLNTELAVKELRADSLRKQEATLQSSYDNVANLSFGLSPNITVERIVHLPAEFLRPRGQYILIGGFIGFFLWILAQLIRIGRRDYEQ